MLTNHGSGLLYLVKYLVAEHLDFGFPVVERISGLVFSWEIHVLESMDTSRGLPLRDNKGQLSWRVRGAE